MYILCNCQNCSGIRHDYVLNMCYFSLKKVPQRTEGVLALLVAFGGVHDFEDLSSWDAAEDLFSTSKIIPTLVNHCTLWALAETPDCFLESRINKIRIFYSFLLRMRVHARPDDLQSVWYMRKRMTESLAEDAVKVFPVLREDQSGVPDGCRLPMGPHSRRTCFRACAHG